MESKSKEYHNKLKRNECYDILVAKVKEIDPVVNRNLIAKKINNLRSTYHKERKKVVESKTSGCGTEYMYIPNLWYIDQETPSQSTSSIVGSDTEASKTT